MLSPLSRRPKLRDEIVQQLLESVRLRDLKPGDFLPNERDLAARFGVSRASVRDAIAQLETLGYVQSRQGEGTIVLDPTGADLARPFLSLMAGRPFMEDNLLEFRVLLEPGVAALAALRATTEDLAALAASLDLQRARAAEGLHLSEADVAFHELIAQTARNEVATEVLGALHELLLDLRVRAMSESRPKVTLAEHEEIFAAIAARDATAARAAMQTHLDTVVNRVRDLAKSSKGAGVGSPASSPGASGAVDRAPATEVADE
jgi:GntR family transcriptional repressor for pyruvate dehydrogenase complex